MGCNPLRVVSLGEETDRSCRGKTCKTQGEDGHLHVEERDPRRNQCCQHTDLRLVAPRIVTKSWQSWQTRLVSAAQSIVLCYGHPGNENIWPPPIRCQTLWSSLRWLLGVFYIPKNLIDSCFRMQLSYWETVCFFWVLLLWFVRWVQSSTQSKANYFPSLKLDIPECPAHCPVVMGLVRGNWSCFTGTFWEVLSSASGSFLTCACERRSAGHTRWSLKISPEFSLCCCLLPALCLKTTGMPVSPDPEHLTHNSGGPPGSTSVPPPCATAESWGCCRARLICLSPLRDHSLSLRWPVFWKLLFHAFCLTFVVVVSVTSG